MKPNRIEYVLMEQAREEIKMKKIAVILIVLFAAAGLSAEKVADLSELNKPGTIAVDTDQIYIAEGSTVFIYSRKDFNFIKKFGKKGEGPQEFNVRQSESVEVLPLEDKLMINSLQKISYYTKDGAFIKEIRPKTMYILPYRPIGDKFVGFGFKQDNQKRFLTLNLYGKDLKKIKEIYTNELPVPAAGQIDPIKQTQSYEMFSQNNKIFYLQYKGVVPVFDENGSKLYEIVHKSKKIKITQDRIDRYLNFFKTDPRTRSAYEQVKARVKFKEFFPPIRSMKVAEGNVYLVTYKEDGNNREFFIYDEKGKLIKQVMLPLIELNGLFLSPYTICKNKIYQVVENIDDEEWELHVSKIL